jgi:GT2 family glycosyltransferase
MDSHPDVGMCASCVQLQDGSGMDSAGMLICADASSTQRGHGLPVSQFAQAEEVLLPSGSAAIYRRTMLTATGAFDPDFFLYCEDTDLGLRAVRAGWRCRYVPDAKVEHRYSHSAGRASSLKAYYVERNRLWVAIKNFPLGMLAAAPFVTVARYFWHAVFLTQGRGKAAQFAEGGAMKLAWLVLRAHLATLAELPALLAKRRAILATSRLTSAEFERILRRHAIPAKQVASH